MKKNYLSYAFVFSLLAVGTVNAQKKDLQIEKKVLDQKGSPSMIMFKKSSNYSVYQAKEVVIQDLGLQNTSFRKTKVNNDDLGFTHEKQQQFHKGIKVEFGQYNFHAKNGSVQFATGKIYRIEKENLTPNLSKQAAFNKAIQHTGAEKYMWEFPEASKELDNYKKPEGELLLLPGEVIGQKDARLAYKFDIFATKPLSRGYLYIDAQNGEVLFYNAIIKHAETFGHVGEAKHVA